MMLSSFLPSTSKPTNITLKLKIGLTYSDNTLSEHWIMNKFNLELEGHSFINILVTKLIYKPLAF